jgi:hypothetical protein
MKKIIMSVIILGMVLASLGGCVIVPYHDDGGGRYGPGGYRGDYYGHGGYRGRGDYYGYYGYRR